MASSTPWYPPMCKSMEQIANTRRSTNEAEQPAASSVLCIVACTREPKAWMTLSRTSQACWPRDQQKRNQSCTTRGTSATDVWAHMANCARDKRPWVQRKVCSMDARCMDRTFQRTDRLLRGLPLPTMPWGAFFSNRAKSLIEQHYRRLATVADCHQIGGRGEHIQSDSGKGKCGGCCSAGSAGRIQ